jgi:hypothetical protein
VGAGCGGIHALVRGVEGWVVHCAVWFAQGVLAEL